MLAGVLTAACQFGTRRPQNRFSGSPVDPELLHELIERHAVREPIEQMLHGKSATAETRRPRSSGRDRPRPRLPTSSLPSSCGASSREDEYNWRPLHPAR